MLAMRQHVVEKTGHMARFYFYDATSQQCDNYFQWAVSSVG
jgi:hypothetical protein